MRLVIKPYSVCLLYTSQVDSAIAARRQVAIKYREALSGVDGITFFDDMPGVKHNYSYFPIPTFSTFCLCTVCVGWVAFLSEAPEDSGRSLITFILTGSLAFEVVAVAAVSYTHLDVYKRQNP